MASLVRSYAAYLGDLYSSNYGRLDIDCTGGSLLVVAIFATGGITAHDPSVTLAEYPLARRPEVVTGVEGALTLWTYELPPAGTHELLVIAHDPGFPEITPELMGPTCCAAFVLADADADIAVELAKAEGMGLSDSIGGVGVGDHLAAGLFQVYGVTSVPSVSGWTHGQRATSAYVDVDTWGRTGSGTVTFDATSSEYRFFYSVLIRAADGAIVAPFPGPALKTIEVTGAAVFMSGGIDTSGSSTVSIDFDFRTPGVLPPSTTFARASTAAYVDAGGDPAVAPVNVPAWTYTAGGEYRGLINAPADGAGRAADQVMLSIVEGVYVVTIERESGTTGPYIPDSILPWTWTVPQDPSPLRFVRLQSPGGPTDGTGIGGTVEALETFDCGTGAELLLIALTYPSAPPPPAVTFAGIAARPIAGLENDLSPTADPHVGRMILFAVPNPPAGPQQLRVWDGDRYIGQLVIHCLAVKGISGVMGARVTKSPWQVDAEMHFGAGTRPGSKLIVMDASMWAQPSGGMTLEADAPWSLLASVEGDYGKGWMWEADGGGIRPIFLHRSIAFGWMQLMGIELYPALDEAPDITGTSSLALSMVTVEPNLSSYLPQADGQKVVTYYCSWFDRPALWGEGELAGARSIHDYMLVKTPPYVDRLILHASAPRYTYAGLDSNVLETTGLSWPGTARDLRDAIALLRQRCPHVEVLVSIMQLYREGGGGIYATGRDPYDPLGFGGMTADNWAAIRRFVDDMGLDGIDLDYECGSLDNDIAKHCWLNAAGQRECYTDAELVSVIKAARVALPRSGGYVITMAAQHVGCYGEPGSRFTNAKPGGWNSGYNLCIARDPVALAALDGFHLMSYDAGAAFDPVECLRSYQHYFPTIPAFIGLRLGGKEWGPTPDQMPRRSMNDFRHYINASIVEESGGAMVYAPAWDAAEPSADRYSPTGVYDWGYPDDNMLFPFLGGRFGSIYTHVPITVRRTSWPWRSALYLASCIEIRRRDGAVYRFVARDRDLIFEGEVYEAAGGVQGSDQVAEDGAEAGSVEVLGYAASAAISDDDIRAGRFDGAEVIAFTVDWAGELDGEELFGRIGETAYLIKRITRNDDGTWRAEMVDRLDLLSREVGRYARRSCPWTLGDTRCQVDLAAYTDTATITTMTDARRIFTASAAAVATDGYYASGLATFVTGANAGLSMEIASYSAGRAVSLAMPLPFDLAIGDQVDLVKGCDGSWAACKAFGNAVNFGGFPAMPGTGEMARFARAGN